MTQTIRTQRLRSPHALLAFLGDSDLGGFNHMGFDVPLWLAECKRHGISFEMKGRRLWKLWRLGRVSRCARPLSAAVC